MAMISSPRPLILASQSAARQHMLRQAGVDFSIQKSALNEDDLREKLMQSMTAPETMALALAQAKALSVAHDNPDAAVIGADQILHYNGKIFNKARNIDEAKANLSMLSGKQHGLISAVCVVQGGKSVWHHIEKSRLSMRVLSPAAIDVYAARAGGVLTECVGGYALEGLGAWLFDSVDGDFFTILGMPLIPLLHHLRTHGQGF